MPLDSLQAAAVSVLPARVAISIAWDTRDALVGLFLGIASAGVLDSALHPSFVGVPPDLEALGPAITDIQLQDGSESWTLHLGGLLPD